MGMTKTLELSLIHNQEKISQFKITDTSMINEITSIYPIEGLKIKLGGEMFG